MTPKDDLDPNLFKSRRRHPIILSRVAVPPRNRRRCENVDRAGWCKL